MKTSEKIDLISKALCLAQNDIGAAVKGSQNPYFKSKYADLQAVIEAVKEPLNKHGISFLQLVNSNGDGDKLETILLHESGQFISAESKVYCNKPNDPQAFGSGITYAKRYALQAALGLPTEDDDGNAASQKLKADATPQPDSEIMDKLAIMLEENTDGQPVSKPKLQSLLWAKLKKYPQNDKEAISAVKWILKNNLLTNVVEAA